MNLTLRKLECVIALAETRNFARAAERLGVSQPALSRTIAQLETDYGLRLFERGKGGISLTGPGDALLADARRLSTLAQLADRNLRDQAVGEGGIVRIGKGPLPAGLLLKQLLTGTVKDRPGLAVTCTVDSAERLLVRLSSGELDFCVISETLLPATDVHSLRMIGTITLGLFVRAGHPLAGSSAVSPEELARFPVASGNSAMGQNFGPFTVTIASDDFSALCGLMLDTDAVFLGSHGLVATQLASGAAVELRLVGDWRPAPTRIVVVRTAGRSQSRAVREMIDRVAVGIGELPGMDRAGEQDPSARADRLLGAAPQ
jgi:DNA-binding transcriptional LysR family regulator